MSRFQLEVFANEAELARSVAGTWLAAVAARRAAGQSCGVALAGGRIARRFFSAVTRQALAVGERLGGVDFFWGDERGVPPDDAESNYGIAAEMLLRPLGISAARVHRICGELNPSEAAAKAGVDLCAVAARGSETQPVLDWVFLGMGEDGHVASLFPGEIASEMDSPAIYRNVVAVKPPPQRITLGYAALAAAREVWVLASGAGKETVLRESLTSEGRTPLARVIDSRTRTRIFTDLRID